MTEVKKNQHNNANGHNNNNTTKSNDSLFNSTNTDPSLLTNFHNCDAKTFLNQIPFMPWSNQNRDSSCAVQRSANKVLASKEDKAKLERQENFINKLKKKQLEQLMFSDQEVPNNTHQRLRKKLEKKQIDKTASLLVNKENNDHPNGLQATSTQDIVNSDTSLPPVRCEGQYQQNGDDHKITPEETNDNDETRKLTSKSKSKSKPNLKSKPKLKPNKNQKNKKNNNQNKSKKISKKLNKNENNKNTIDDNKNDDNSNNKNNNHDTIDNLKIDEEIEINSNAEYYSLQKNKSNQLDLHTSTNDNDNDNVNKNIVKNNVEIVENKEAHSTNLNSELSNDNENDDENKTKDDTVSSGNVNTNTTVSPLEPLFIAQNGNHENKNDHDNNDEEVNEERTIIPLTERNEQCDKNNDNDYNDNKNAEGVKNIEKTTETLIVKNKNNGNKKKKPLNESNNKLIDVDKTDNNKETENNETAIPLQEAKTTVTSNNSIKQSSINEKSKKQKKKKKTKQSSKNGTNKVSVKKIAQNNHSGNDDHENDVDNDHNNNGHYEHDDHDEDNVKTRSDDNDNKDVDSEDSNHLKQSDNEEIDEKTKNNKKNSFNNDIVNIDNKHWNIVSNSSNKHKTRKHVNKSQTTKMNEKKINQNNNENIKKKEKNNTEFFPEQTTMQFQSNKTLNKNNGIVLHNTKSIISTNIDNTQSHIYSPIINDNNKENIQVTHNRPTKPPITRSGINAKTPSPSPSNVFKIDNLNSKILSNINSNNNYIDNSISSFPITMDNHHNVIDSKESSLSTLVNFDNNKNISNALNSSLLGSNTPISNINSTPITSVSSTPTGIRSAFSVATPTGSSTIPTIPIIPATSNVIPRSAASTISTTYPTTLSSNPTTFQTLPYSQTLPMTTTPLQSSNVQSTLTNIPAPMSTSIPIPVTMPMADANNNRNNSADNGSFAFLSLLNINNPIVPNLNLSFPLSSLNSNSNSNSTFPLLISPLMPSFQSLTTPSANVNTNENNLFAHPLNFNMNFANSNLQKIPNTTTAITANMPSTMFDTFQLPASNQYRLYPNLKFSNCADNIDVTDNLKYKIKEAAKYTKNTPYFIQNYSDKLIQDLTEEEKQSKWVTMEHLDSKQYPPDLWCLNMESFNDHSNASLQHMQAFMNHKIN